MGRRGVAVLIRSDLLASDRLHVIDSSVTPSPDGRRLAMRLRWQGHALTLLVLYMPNQRQSEFIQQSVTPWLAQHCTPGTNVILAGDFNMTFGGSIDCVAGAAAAGAGAHDPAALISDYTDAPARAMLGATAAHDLCLITGL
jgi:exonuclease III